MIKIVNEAIGNDNIEELKSLADNYGYVLADVGRARANRRSRISIQPRDRDAYLPEIIDSGDEFKIQTSSYGSLGTEEFSTFVTSQKMALTMVQRLNNFDFTGVTDTAFYGDELD